MPDLIVGYDYLNSDELNELAFHELGHASNYKQVGDVYWREVINAEINANGHGNQNSPDAGLIAVVESWAEYIGKSYSNRLYGTMNSFDPGVNFWIAFLEATHNESENHVPIGLHWDLMDDSPLESDSWDSNDIDFWSTTSGTAFLIDDQVSGFTNHQMFYSLNANVTSPIQYRNWLNTNYTITTGNSVNDVNDLFNSY